MNRLRKLLSNTRGRFISITAQNSKFPKLDFSAKVLELTPNYVKLYTPALGTDVTTLRLSSIRRVQSGSQVVRA